MTPGFSAETSPVSIEFGLLPLAIAAGSGLQPVRLAQDSCTCTSPNCTWSLPGSLRWAHGLRTNPLHLQAGTGWQSNFRHPPAMFFSLLLLITFPFTAMCKQILCSLRQHMWPAPPAIAGGGALWVRRVWEVTAVCMSD